MNSGKRNYWLPLILALCTIIGMWAGMNASDKMPDLVSASRAEKVAPSDPVVVDEIIKYIASNYVDSIDTERLNEIAINAILQELDPYSYYSHSKNSNILEGNYDGIGIHFLMLNDSVYITHVYENSAAYESGLQSGDIILTVNGLKVTAMSDFSEEIAGIFDKNNGEVRMQIKRGKENFFVKLKKGQVHLNSVGASFSPASDVGLIQLQEFTSRSYDDFLQALDSLVIKYDVKHLILDLRNNSGGYLQEAIKILSQLIGKSSKLLVSTEGSGNRNQEYHSKKIRFFDIENIVVLVDEYSASASEIVAGVLQDYDRATVIGRRTFGKGLVQQRYELTDGSTLSITTGKYYLPSGRAVQINLKDVGSNDKLKERIRHGELFDSTKIHYPDTTSYYTLIRKRKVYANNGIVPDVFVPLDSMEIVTGIPFMSQYSLEFLLPYFHEEFKNFEPEKDSLNNDFAQKFIEFINRETLINMPVNDFTIFHAVRSLKVGIARLQGKEDLAYKIANNIDPIYQEGLKRITP